MIQTPAFTSQFLRGAALILLRDHDGLEVLLLQRSPFLRAYPNYWAFPGGKQDPSDQNLEDTALRELFEETALYLTPKVINTAQRQQWQTALNTGQLSWQSLRPELGYSPDDYDEMKPIGWRITPPFQTVRFEAAYHYALYPYDLPPLISEEAQQAQWWKPETLLRLWSQGEALVPPPVLNVLHTLVHARIPISPAIHQQLSSDHHNRETLPLPIIPQPGVESLPLRTPTLEPATHTNTYLVGARDFVIIDPATPYPQEQALLTAQVERRLQQGHRAQAILLTHHHSDHIGAAAHLQQAFQLPVMAHSLTQKRLKQQAYPLRIDRTLDSGETWVLDDPHYPMQLEAIHTPGHAPGHLCFIDRQRKLGFVGDMVAGIGSIVIQHPANSTDPDGHMQSYLKSLQLLIDLDLKRAFPAHGPMVTHPSQTFADYIHHRLQREAHIEAALLHSDSPRKQLSISQLRDLVYPNLDSSLATFAEDSLRAHLVKLEQEQRVMQRTPGFYTHPNNIE